MGVARARAPGYVVEGAADRRGGNRLHSDSLARTEVRDGRARTQTRRDELPAAMSGGPYGTVRRGSGGSAGGLFRADVRTRSGAARRLLAGLGESLGLDRTGVPGSTARPTARRGRGGCRDLQ